MTSTTISNGYRKYLIFGVASLALLMASIDATIVATALPAIQKGFGSEINWTGWVITVYQLTMMIMMPLMGRISDEWGRKRIFIACIALFTVSSYLCAQATNIFALIFFRFLQAIGGGSIMPSAIGIVGDSFHEHRARAIGLFTTIFPLGGIIGPALGGIMLSFYSWKAIFLVNVPVGLVLIFIAFFLLDTDQAVTRTEIDFAGAGLFAGAILSMMYFMTRLGESPEIAAEPVNYLLPLLSLLFLFLFIRREKRTKTPILDLTLLRSRPFAVMNAINIIHGACILGMSSFIPYYAQTIYGMSDLTSGALLSIRAVGVMITATVTSMLIERSGYRLPMGIGFVVLIVSTLGMVPLLGAIQIPGIEISDYWRLAIVVFLAGVGVGMVSPSSNNAAIELMPEKISAISGLRGMFRGLGGVFGTSLTVLALSRFPDKEVGFTVVFIGMSVLLGLAMILLKDVPDGPNVRKAEDKKAVPITTTRP